MKMNKKIIRLKRYTKLLFHCERSVAILLALALVLSFSLVTAVPVGAQGMTYTVDDDWQVDPPYAEDTDGDTDFATINAAINTAGSGDTINVAAGIYLEDVTVNVERVTIKGESLDAIVDGGFLLSANDITIDGLTVINGHVHTPQPLAIYTGATDNHCIINNDFIGPNDATGYGIRTDSGSNNIEIDNNKIYGWRIGVMQEGEPNGKITVTKNEIYYNTKTGIDIGEGCDIDIRYNNIYNNGEYGIYLYEVGVDLTGAVINYNNIYGNGDYGLFNQNPTVSVNATNNWWGHASGPNGVGLGSGDAVSDNVDYAPWYTDAAMSSLSDETEITSYKFEAANTAALTSDVIGAINSTNHTVSLTVPYGTDVTSLKATFELSAGATAKVVETTQESGVTPNDFTSPVTYTITSLDKTTIQDWTVTVTIVDPNTDATLSDLTIDGTTISGFDSSTLTYNQELPYGTTTVPTVGATPTDSNASKVITQATNLTGTEAERTATVVVTAEDGITTKTYKVIFGSIKVTITKTGPTTANQGNNIIYTITYKNEGTFNATNVVITETYPSEVEYVSATPAPDTGNKQWTIDTLAPGEGGTITVTVHIK